MDANEATREAVAWVTPDQQSLAIGKKGQNVRLAAKLTGWKIDIRIPENMAQQAAKEPEAALGEASAPTPEPTPTEAPPTTEPTPDEQKAV